MELERESKNTSNSDVGHMTTTPKMAKLLTKWDSGWPRLDFDGPKPRRRHADPSGEGNRILSLNGRGTYLISTNAHGWGFHRYVNAGVSCGEALPARCQHMRHSRSSRWVRPKMVLTPRYLCHRPQFSLTHLSQPNHAEGASFRLASRKRTPNVFGTDVAMPRFTRDN